MADIAVKTYAVKAICDNCRVTVQLAIPMGTPITKTACSWCGVIGLLRPVVSD